MKGWTHYNFQNSLQKEYISLNITYMHRLFTLVYYFGILTIKIDFSHNLNIVVSSRTQFYKGTGILFMGFICPWQFSIILQSCYMCDIINISIFAIFIMTNFFVLGGLELLYGAFYYAYTSRNVKRQIGPTNYFYK